LLGLNVGQQSLQSRALHGSTREAAVIVAGVEHLPAFARLTFHVCFTRFALRIETVK